MSLAPLTPVAARIDALLPQTQCTRCGYSGCAPYAQAIERGEADINQCPPGGSQTIGDLARLLHRAPKPLNPANGIEVPQRVAVIDAERCIGCAKCLPPCPVDAILGARKFLHVVIRERCTGCELCIAPCPVDCIRMQPAEAGQAPNDRGANRRRHQAHQERQQARARQRELELARGQSAVLGTEPRA